MAKRSRKGCIKRSVRYCWRAGKSHRGKKHCGRRTICARRKR